MSISEINEMLRREARSLDDMAGVFTQEAIVMREAAAKLEELQIQKGTPKCKRILGEEEEHGNGAELFRRKSDVSGLCDDERRSWRNYNAERKAVQCVCNSQDCRI